MNTITVKTSDLEGAALDWAVARATKAWGWAHEWFPTMTLDASFSGVQPIVFADGQARCQLVPRNPMRQGYEIFNPSTDWNQGGPLIDRYRVSVEAMEDMEWDARAAGARRWSIEAKTPLIAAMRAIVGAELGDEVDIPKELLEAS